MKRQVSVMTTYVRYTNRKISPLHSLVRNRPDTHCRESVYVMEQPVQILNASGKYRLYVNIERQSEAIMNCIIDGARAKYVLYGSKGAYRKITCRTVIKIPHFHKVYLVFDLDIIPVFPLILKCTRIYRYLVPGQLSDIVELPDNNWYFPLKTNWYSRGVPTDMEHILDWAGHSENFNVYKVKQHTVVRPHPKFICEPSSS